MSYRYYFADGYICHMAYKMSNSELLCEERIHGKCIRVVKVR